RGHEKHERDSVWLHPVPSSPDTDEGEEARAHRAEGTTVGSVRTVTYAWRQRERALEYALIPISQCDGPGKERRVRVVHGVEASTLFHATHSIAPASVPSYYRVDTRGSWCAEGNLQEFEDRSRTPAAGLREDAAPPLARQGRCG